VDMLKKLERIEMIIREACEQSERCFVPRLHEVLKFGDFVENRPKGMILAGDARIFDKKLSEVKIEGDVNLVIGPEGGLTDLELEEIKRIGGVRFLLGETVLRMETAAISALSVVQFG